MHLHELRTSFQSWKGIITMFCRKCGTEFEGNFCPNCGCEIIRVYTPDEPEEPKPVKPDNKPVDPYIIALKFGLLMLLSMDTTETTASENITIISPSPELTSDQTTGNDDSLSDTFKDGFKDGLGNNYEESIDSTKEHIEGIKDILQ